MAKHDIITIKKSSNTYKVGILNTNPEYTLDINGNLRINDQIVSSLVTGNAPFNVTSTTQVNNLNVQYLQGAEPDEDDTNSKIAKRTSTGNLKAKQFVSTIPDGTSPLTVTSKKLVSNLNAEYLDGKTGDTASTANTVVVRDTNKHIAVGGIRDGVLYSNDYSTLIKPQGGSLTWNTNRSGMVRVSIPIPEYRSGSFIMLTIKHESGAANNKAYTLYIKGHINYTSTSSSYGGWYSIVSAFCTLVAGSVPPVRFSYYNGKPCIYIGNLTDRYQGGTTTVESITLSYYINQSVTYTPLVTEFVDVTVDENNNILTVGGKNVTDADFYHTDYFPRDEKISDDIPVRMRTINPVPSTYATTGTTSGVTIDTIKDSLVKRDSSGNTGVNQLNVLDGIYSAGNNDIKIEPASGKNVIINDRIYIGKISNVSDDIVEIVNPNYTGALLLRTRNNLGEIVGHNGVTLPSSYNNLHIRARAVGSAAQLSLLTTGQVGINTSSPTAQFHVVGDIKATGTSGSITADTTVTAGTGITATTGDIVASSGDIKIRDKYYLKATDSGFAICRV